MVYKKKSYSRKMKRSSPKVKKSNGLKTTKQVVNPALKRIVKRMMHSEAETKCAIQDIWVKTSIPGTGVNNQATPAYGLTFPTTIIPPMVNGTGQGTRIGNRIQPVKLQIRGYVNALPTTVNTGNNYWPNEAFYVRIIVYCLKSQIAINANNSLLDNGVSAEDFTGGVDSLLLPYNRERFHIAKTVQFALQPPNNPLTTSGSSIANPAVNNNLRTMRLFKFNVKLPKTLTYVDGTSYDPSNCRWHMAAAVVNQSGYLAASTDHRAQISAQAIMYYRDE